MQNIDIKLKPSRYFIGFLILLWFFGNIIILFTQIHFLIKILLWIAIFVYALDRVSVYGLLLDEKSVTTLQLQDAQWYIKNRPMRLLGDSTVTRFISILRFQCHITKKIYVSVVLPDSVCHVPYRQLVMLLRTVDIFTGQKVRYSSSK